MRVTVRFFVSRGEAEVELEAGSTVGDCLAALINESPEIEPMVKFGRCLVGGAGAANTYVLSDNDVVTVIPQFPQYPGG